MRDSVIEKLNSLKKRHLEVSNSLSDPDVITDQNKFRTLSKEYKDLQPIIEAYNSYQEAAETIEMSEELLKDSDPEIKAMAEEERKQAEEDVKKFEADLNILLLPKDPNDDKNVFLEIRAGTGGDEASIFVGDLFRMYSKYAETQSWQTEVLNASEGEHGGYKELICKIIGDGAYSKLKFESGAHRVQRVPATESQGRIHTSACTVAILPEVEEVDNIDINPSDLRVDTYRASGAGGQHVNKTDSAVRITHIPTNTIVECQEERSQHKNRAKAMSLLSAKILQKERERQRQEQAQSRRDLVGSGDRSERIRTYNFPQGRITDHRINLTLYKLEEAMEGNLAPIIDPLIREHQMDLLASVGE